MPTVILARVSRLIFASHRAAIVQKLTHSAYGVKKETRKHPLAIHFLRYLARAPTRQKQFITICSMKDKSACKSLPNAKTQNGSVLVELAILMTFFAIMINGAIDIQELLYHHGRISDALRNAGRMVARLSDKLDEGGRAASARALFATQLGAAGLKPDDYELTTTDQPGIYGSRYFVITAQAKTAKSFLNRLFADTCSFSFVVEGYDIKHGECYDANWNRTDCPTDS